MKGRTRKGDGCRCESNFTCGHCLRNAPPWFCTPSTIAEQAARWFAEHQSDDQQERNQRLGK
jgi:hypothetical protein